MGFWKVYSFGARRKVWEGGKVGRLERVRIRRLVEEE